MGIRVERLRWRMSSLLLPFEYRYVFWWKLFPFFRISPSSTQGDLNNSAMPCIEFKFSNNNSSILTSNLSFGTKYPINDESADSLVSTTAPLQTTLVSVKANCHRLRLIAVDFMDLLFGFYYDNILDCRLEFVLFLPLKKFFGNLKVFASKQHNRKPQILK